MTSNSTLQTIDIPLTDSPQNFHLVAFDNVDVLFNAHQIVIEELEKCAKLSTLPMSVDAEGMAADLAENFFDDDELVDVDKLLEEKYKCMSLPQEEPDLCHLSPKELEQMNPRYYNYKLSSLDEHKRRQSPSFNFILSASAIVIASVVIIYLHSSTLTIKQH